MIQSPPTPFALPQMVLEIVKVHPFLSHPVSTTALPAEHKAAFFALLPCIIAFVPLTLQYIKSSLISLVFISGCPLLKTFVPG